MLRIKLLLSCGNRLFWGCLAVWGWNGVNWWVILADKSMMELSIPLYDATKFIFFMQKKTKRFFQVHERPVSKAIRTKTCVEIACRERIGVIELVPFETRSGRQLHENHVPKRSNSIFRILQINQNLLVRWD